MSQHITVFILLPNIEKNLIYQDSIHLKPNMYNIYSKLLWTNVCKQVPHIFSYAKTHGHAI